ncbi:MAG: hypothetical protein H6766_04445 [Candidatus Peribacteria bacterium]|nr:MAG: hypothetical protein H6766_04445 [Candidatus Peribacteria bacterium]
MPYYHGNLDYDYEVNNYDYDVRYDTNNYRVDNSITHSDTYNIYADDVDIDNNYYYGNYGPYWNTGTYPVVSILENLPAPERCTTQRHSARSDSYFADLGLRIPSAVTTIQKYRIRRSDGDRSRRYIPGDNDVDSTSRYLDRRMRRYFGRYTHEITTCTSAISSTYSTQNNYYNNTSSYGSYTHPSYSAGYQQTYRNVIAGAQSPTQSNTRYTTYDSSRYTTTDSEEITTTPRWNIYRYSSSE